MFQNVKSTQITYLRRVVQKQLLCYKHNGNVPCAGETRIGLKKNQKLKSENIFTMHKISLMRIHKYPLETFVLQAQWQ